MNYEILLQLRSSNGWQFPISASLLIVGCYWMHIQDALVTCVHIGYFFLINVARRLKSALFDIQCTLRLELPLFHFLL